MLTIGEVARRAGLRTSAMRYYEEVGVLPPATRSGCQRRYDESVLARLAVVRLAQAVGFSLAEIRAIVSFRGTRNLVTRRNVPDKRDLYQEDDGLSRSTRGMRRVLRQCRSIRT